MSEVEYFVTKTHRVQHYDGWGYEVTQGDGELLLRYFEERKRERVYIDEYRISELLLEPLLVIMQELKESNVRSSGG